MTRRMGEAHDDTTSENGYAITVSAVREGDFIKRRGHRINPGAWVKVIKRDGMTITTVNAAGYEVTRKLNDWDLFYLHPYSYKHNR